MRWEGLLARGENVRRRIKKGVEESSRRSEGGNNEGRDKDRRDILERTDKTEERKDRQDRRDYD